jgi:hypothetical protein
MMKRLTQEEERLREINQGGEGDGSIRPREQLEDRLGNSQASVSVIEGKAHF